MTSCRAILFIFYGVTIENLSKHKTKIEEEGQSEKYIPLGLQVESIVCSVKTDRKFYNQYQTSFIGVYFPVVQVIVATELVEELENVRWSCIHRIQVRKTRFFIYLEKLMEVACSSKSSKSCKKAARKRSGEYLRETWSPRKNALKYKFSGDGMPAQFVELICFVSYQPAH